MKKITDERLLVKRKKDTGILYYIQSFFLIIAIIIESIRHGFTSEYTLPLLCIFLLSIIISTFQELTLSTELEDNKRKSIISLSITFAILFIVFGVIYPPFIKGSMSPTIYFGTMYGSFIVVYIISLIVILKK